MQVSLNPSNLKGWQGEVLVVGIEEGRLEEQIIHLEPLCDNSLSTRLCQENFTAKAGQVSKFHLFKGSPQKLVLVGLGEQEKLQLENIREAAAIGARESIGHTGTIGFFFPKPHILTRPRQGTRIL